VNKLVLKMRHDKPGTNVDVDVQLNGQSVQLVQNVDVNVDAERPLAKVTLVFYADVDTKLVHKMSEPLAEEYGAHEETPVHDE
jgi:hypothetical protein